MPLVHQHEHVKQKGYYFIYKIQKIQKYHILNMPNILSDRATEEAILDVQ